MTYIQTVTDLYDKEVNKINELSKYLERLSSVDNSTPEAINQSVTTLKGLKKDLSLGLNKENKKVDKKITSLIFLTGNK